MPQSEKSRLVFTLLTLSFVSSLIQNTQQAQAIEIEGIGDLDKYLESLDQELDDLQDAVDSEVQNINDAKNSNSGKSKNSGQKQKPKWTKQ